MESSSNKLNVSKLNDSESLFRCSECLFIPFIKITFENGKIYIETKCENCHLNKIEINNYLKTINSNNIKCNSCKKSKIELYYWYEENKFYCNNCKKIVNDKCLNSKKFDSKCKKDFNDFSEFCEKCFKNQCIYCICSHNNNDKIKCNPNIININEVNKMKENLIKGKKFVEKIENEAKNIYEQYLQIFKNNIQSFKEKNQNLIYLCEKILECYINHKENRNLNYQIIENVKNILKFKDFNKKVSLEEIFELNDYLILDNIQIINNKKENENNVSKNIINSFIKKNILNTNYIINNITKPQNENQNTKRDFFDYIKQEEKNKKITEIKVDKSTQTVQTKKEETIRKKDSKEKESDLILLIKEQNSSETLSSKNEKEKEKTVKNKNKKNKDNNNNNEKNNENIDNNDINIIINNNNEKNNNNNENNNNNDNEKKNILKIVPIETSLPIIIKINPTLSKERINKISSEICLLKDNIKIPKRVLEEIFKEYPPLNIYKNLAIKTVENKEYKKEESIYSGEINVLTGEKEGRGITLYKNGDYRLGYFHKNKQIKKGIQYHIEEESWYEGNFINDSQEGYGELFWNDYEYFIGNFKNSELSNGKYFYSDGSIYNGPFVNGKRNGIGEYFGPKKKYLKKYILKMIMLFLKKKDCLRLINFWI